MNLSEIRGLFTYGEILGHHETNFPDGVTFKLILNETTEDHQRAVHRLTPTLARLWWTRLDRYHLHDTDQWNADVLRTMENLVPEYVWHEVEGLAQKKPTQLRRVNLSRKLNFRPAPEVTKAQWRGNIWLPYAETSDGKQRAGEKRFQKEARQQPAPIVKGPGRCSICGQPDDQPCIGQITGRKLKTLKHFDRSRK